MTEAPKTVSHEPTNDMIEAAYPLLSARPIDTPDRAKRMAAEMWRAMWDAAPRPMTMGLTDKQRQVHNFLAEYIGEHGEPPLWREIIAGTGVATTDHLRRIIRSLERMGILSRSKAIKRGIRLHILPGEQVPNPINGNKNKNRKRKAKCTNATKSKSPKLAKS